MNITLATAHSSSYQPLADITAPNKCEYAQRWCLGFEAFTHHDPVTCWQRPEIWLNVLKSNEWLFWMGCDTLITNHTVNVRDLMTKDADLIIAIDGNGLQNDVFLLRSCPETIYFMQRVYRHRTLGTNNEQDAMAIELSLRTSYHDYISNLGCLKQDGEPPSERLTAKCRNELNRSDVRVKIVPQRALNAYPHKFYGGTGSEEHSWHPGDFVMHMPGIPQETRLEYFPHFPIVK